MDYLAKGDDLFGFDDSIGNQIGQWQDSLERIRNASDVLVNTDKIKGHTADRMKEYFSGVYGSIQATLNALLADYSLKWGQYLADYSDLDSDAHFVISTSELESINAEHMAQNSEKGYVEQCVYNAVASVSDISSAVFGGLNYINNQHNSIKSQLDKLGSDVAQIESTHSQSDFVNIDASIQSVSALIAEMSSKDTIYKLNFDGAAFSTSAVYQKLANCYNQLALDVRDNGKQFERIQSARAQRAEQLTAEAEERKKQAETVKTITMGVCIVGGLAATVLTAGAASPILVATISGGVTGAVMAGVNTGADMYAAGGWSNLDWSKIGQEALIGGIVGAATGAISGASTQLFGNFGNALLGKIPQGTSSFVSSTAKVLVKGTTGGLSKAVTGYTSDTLTGIAQGKNVTQALGDASDGVLKNFAAGFTKSAIVAGIDQAIDSKYNTIDEKTGLSKKSDYSIREWVGKNAEFGAFTEVAGGAGSRFVSGFIEQDGRVADRFKNGFSKATDTNEVMTDLVTGSASRAGQEYVRQKPRLQAEKEAQEKVLNGWTTDKGKIVNGNDARIEKRIERGTEGDIKNLKYNKMGIPDFSETDAIYQQEGKKAEVEFTMVNGNARGADKTKFLSAYYEKYGVELHDIPEGYTLHHGPITVNADGTITCKGQLVKTEVHDSVKHVGGAGEQRLYVDSIEESGGKGISSGERFKEAKPYSDQLESNEIYKEYTDKKVEGIKASVKAEKYTKKYGGYKQETTSFPDIKIDMGMPY